MPGTRQCGMGFRYSRSNWHFCLYERAMACHWEHAKGSMLYGHSNCPSTAICTVALYWRIRFRKLIVHPVPKINREKMFLPVFFYLDSILLSLQTSKLLASYMHNTTENHMTFNGYRTRKQQMQVKHFHKNTLCTHEGRG